MEMRLPNKQGIVNLPGITYNYCPRQDLAKMAGVQNTLEAFGVPELGKAAHMFKCILDSIYPKEPGVHIINKYCGAELYIITIASISKGIESATQFFNHKRQDKIPFFTGAQEELVAKIGFDQPYCKERFFYKFIPESVQTKDATSKILQFAGFGVPWSIRKDACWAIYGNINL